VSQSWGAVAHSLIGFAFVFYGGYNTFEKFMKLLVGVMGFSILFCALFTLDNNTAPALRGLLLPSIPAGSGTYVLSLIGGVGGSITMLSYNYWMREEGMRGGGFLAYVRGDIAIAYLFTAIFGGSIMLIANDAFFTAGVALTNAQAVPRMAEALGGVLGTFGRIAFSVGFWAAVFASLLGVWQSVPYLYADFYGIYKKMSPDARRQVVQVTSTPYRLALAFISLVPIPFAFTGQPIQVVIIYTIVSSLFVPFVAATLLYLNNRVPWTEAVPKNSLITNLLLMAILVLFAIVGFQEVRARL
jgi:Mn2+/Fe2+ NRAMP family transporter